jgi:tetratricopeptide (TPR) repeat protein
VDGVAAAAGTLEAVMNPFERADRSRNSNWSRCAWLVLGGVLFSILALAQESPANLPKLTPEQRADIYMARKMFREAVETYQLTNPMTPVVENKIGIAYQQQNDLETAKKYYERAIKENPKYAEAINNRGTIEYARKNFRRATGLYKKALNLEPRSASFLSNLGTAWFARHNYKEAFDYYQQALAIDPEVFERHGSTGSVLEERDVQERAKFNYYMARVYAKSGKNELALQYIRKAIEGGFKDKKKFLEEDDFAGLRKLPEFDDLMKLEPRAL